MKLGFFDSGIGGLMTLRYLREINDCLEVVYLGDVHNFPYGEKDEETLSKLARAGIEFLVKENVEVVVIACNTLSTTVIEELMKVYDVPIVPITLWMEELRDIKGESVVIGTNATIRSRYYQKKLNAIGIPTPELARFVEEGVWEGEQIEDYIREKLPDGDYNLILACTHYSVLKKKFHEILPGVNVIDISEYFVNYLVGRFGIEPRKCSKKGNITIYLTGDKDYSRALKLLGYEEDYVKVIKTEPIFSALKLS